MMRLLRSAVPYINAHRGKIFVMCLKGEMFQTQEDCPSFMQDMALLESLGVRLVLVHGAKPQILSALQREGSVLRESHGFPVVDAHALGVIKSVIGRLQLDIQALLSRGLVNTPFSGARLQVVSGNFIMAKPLGIRQGVDHDFTGEIRRTHVSSIQHYLAAGHLVLISPLGYSPTGDVFYIPSEEAIAAQVAVALAADKLLFFTPEAGLLDEADRLISRLTLQEAGNLKLHKKNGGADWLSAGMRACHAGVKRVHFLSQYTDDALLMELFTPEGSGTLMTEEDIEDIRPASIEDVGGIINLISPLEKEGILVRRSRDLLEREIESFFVITREGTIIGCAALYVFLSEQVGEMASFAVDVNCRTQGRGARLLRYIEDQANKQGLKRLFVLTTHTTHWFLERGFVWASTADLPAKRQASFNSARGSKILQKDLSWRPRDEYDD